MATSLFLNLPKFKNSDVVILNSYLSIVAIFFNRLGLFKYNKLIWFGFFIHSKRYFPLFRLILKFICKKETIVVFSEYEVKLYSTELMLSNKNLRSVPLVFDSIKKDNTYDEFNNDIELKDIPKNYYFSGGYSNRDYVSLIKAFTNINENLVICSSSLNRELMRIPLPKNITIIEDLKRSTFSKVLQNSKAGLLPLKNNTGASGQMFALEAMASRKLVIATKTDVLKEIVDDFNTGFLIDNFEEEIVVVIEGINSGKYSTSNMGEEGFKKLTKEFSHYAFERQMDSILSESRQSYAVLSQ